MQDERAEVDLAAAEACAAPAVAAPSVSRINVAIVMSIGLCTFFFPFVTTDSPIRGGSGWSPFEWLVSRADLWRPAPAPFHMQMVLYQIALIYLLMALALLSLALPRPHNALRLIAIVGAASSIPFVGPSGCREFGWLFFGRFTNGPLWDGSLRGLTRWQGFQFEIAFYVFLAVMPILALLVFRRDRA